MPVVPVSKAPWKHTNSETRRLGGHLRMRISRTAEPEDIASPNNSSLVQFQQQACRRSATNPETHSIAAPRSVATLLKASQKQRPRIGRRARTERIVCPSESCARTFAWVEGLARHYQGFHANELVSQKVATHLGWLQPPLAQCQRCGRLMTNAGLQRNRHWCEGGWMPRDTENLEQL